MTKVLDWVFTFGFGHKYPKGYVIIRGTRESSREEMFKRYKKWAFQYPSKEDAGVYKFNLFEVKED